MYIYVHVALPFNRLGLCFPIQRSGTFHIPNASGYRTSRKLFYIKIFFSKSLSLSLSLCALSPTDRGRHKNKKGER